MRGYPYVDNRLTKVLRIETIHNIHKKFMRKLRTTKGVINDSTYFRNHTQVKNKRTLRKKN